MFLAVIDKAIVLAVKRSADREWYQTRFTHHFIRHHEQIELFRNGGDLLKFFPREDLANRVVRSVDDDYLSARGDSAAKK